MFEKYNPKPNGFKVDTEEFVRIRITGEFFSFLFVITGHCCL